MGIHIKDLGSSVRAKYFAAGHFYHFQNMLPNHILHFQGLRVILAGLDMDFRGEPFGPMPLLMAEAEEVTKLQAICVVCGAPASRTQRLIDGQPAAYDDPIILVGGSESYEARCRQCHEVPRERA